MGTSKAIRWSLGLTIALGVYGVIINEPYWRDVGHGPELYDYFFWFALAINGPSGFLSDYLSWLTTSQSEERFLIQYSIWCALLWPQWKLYERLVRWSQEKGRKQVAFYVLVVLLIVGGGLAAYKAWWHGHRPSECFVDQYFLFVRIGGISCSGVVLLVYAHLVKKHAVTLGSGETAQKRPAR